MGSTIDCTSGVLDCGVNTATGVCADYDGTYLDLKGMGWLATCGFVLMCFMSFYVGANDVANSWGTSVGSKAISIRSACLIAGIANWLGAVTLGYGVSDTIQTGVGDIRDEDCWACGYCDTQMSVYAVGMLAALFGASILIMLATFTSMPVSTTHSIVGGVVGSTLFGVGSSCLHWGFDGLGGIVSSWVISPVLSGFIGIVVYLVTNRYIMQAETPDKNALLALPFLFCISSIVILLLILLNSPMTSHWNLNDSTYGAVVSGIIIGVIAQLALVPLVRRKMPSKTAPLVLLSVGELDEQPETSDVAFENNRSTVMSEAEARYEMEYSSLSVEQKDAMFVFRYLLVVVAALESYAHGSNDTANATGPLSAIFHVYNDGLNSCNPIEASPWIMALAGGFVFLGINVQGRAVIETIGKRISVMNMHRAFCIELASTSTVVIATILKLPVSTSHCQVGAVLFVSLIAVGPRNVSFPLLGKIGLTWLITLPFAGVVAAVFLTAFRSSIKL